ncbi:hypothetical protein QBK99_21875 [Corticibacterium sp. UT-5YL-CI-8]|nr:hypothetical protein [Tianweitania sp. UT-5YL-CI-8]
MPHSNIRIIATALSYTLVFSSASSHAADPVDFSGKQIEMIVPSQAGGGGDVFARGVAERLAKALPGQPTIIIKNVPGGGTVTGANYFQKQAKPDGEMIFVNFSSHLLYSTFQAGQSQIQFEPKSWIPIMGGPSGYVISGSKVGGVTSLQDLAKADSVTWGVTSTLGIGLLYVLGLDVMGINIKPVFNVDGSDATLSFQRGEFHLDSETIASHVRVTQPLVEKGEIFPLFTVGQPGPDGSVIRDAALPGVPNFVEAYQIVNGKAPEGEGFEVWKKLFGALIANSRGVVLAPGTPPEIVAAYDEAIKKALSGPNDAGLATLLGAAPQFFGDEARASYSQAIKDLTPELRDWVTKWMKERYGVVL